MMRKLTVTVVVLAGMFGTAGAQAATTPRDAATDQYGTTPVIGTPTTPTETPVAGSGTTTTAATTPTTTTTTSESVPTSTTEPVDGSGDPTSTTPKDDSGSAPSGGSGGTTSPSSGSGSAAGGTTSGFPANRVAVVEFGKAQKKLKENIDSALKLAGLQTLFLGELNKKRFDAFLASPILNLLSAGGVGPAGQAFGAQLVNPTPVARQAFAALFGPKTQFVPVIRAVLTRRIALDSKKVKFMKGVATGLQSTAVPLAYVERSDVKKSFVKQYRKLKVLTVDDIDTAAGQQRLAQIMLGQITTQKAVDAVKADPASAVIADADGGTGATPWILLAVLFGGVAFMASGTARRRSRRSAA